MRVRIADVREENDLESLARRPFDRRRALKLFAAAGAAGVASPALAACSTSTAAPTAPGAGQTLRVGLIVPQTGPLQDIGFQMLNGFQLYMQQTNHQIAGATVSSHTIDEGTSTASGVAAVKNALASKQYDVLVGIANADVLAAVADDVTAARTPVIGTNGSPANMHASVFLWRTSFVAGESSRALAGYISQAPPGKSVITRLRRPSKVVVYHDSSSDAMTEAKTFMQTLGGPTITMQEVTGTNLSSVMSQIGSWQPDLVYAAVGPAAGAPFITAYAAAGIPAVLCGPGALTEQSKQVPAAGGIFTSMNYAPDLANKANETFTSAYLGLYSGQLPTAYAMTTYDAGSVLEGAISKIDGEVTSQSINAALGTPLSFESPRGRWQFNQARTPLQQWYLRQVRPDGTVLDNMALADLEALT
jgi:branched-chain amino acid transport system substrate-binding protein